MSEANVELVRAAYEAFSRGDFSFVAEFDDDFEFVTSPEVPDAGTYRGQAAREWVRQWVGSFEDMTMEATEIVDAGDKVFVGILQRGRIRGSETPAEGRWWNVITFREGRMVRSELYPDRDRALEAAGLGRA
jgi:ketosteroid isomerase-like protein